jgi:hypothetical protein
MMTEAERALAGVDAGADAFWLGSESQCALGDDAGMDDDTTSARGAAETGRALTLYQAFPAKLR